MLYTKRGGTDLCLFHPFLVCPPPVERRAPKKFERVKKEGSRVVRARALAPDAPPRVPACGKRRLPGGHTGINFLRRRNERRAPKKFERVKKEGSRVVRARALAPDAPPRVPACGKRRFPGGHTIINFFRRRNERRAPKRLARVKKEGSRVVRARAPAPDAPPRAPACGKRRFPGGHTGINFLRRRNERRAPKRAGERGDPVAPKRRAKEGKARAEKRGAQRIVSKRMSQTMRTASSRFPCSASYSRG